MPEFRRSPEQSNLTSRESEPVKPPYPEIHISEEEKIAFRTIDELPDTLEAQEPLELPKMVREHVEEITYSGSTYHETIRRPDWEQTISVVIDDFLKTEQGAKILEQLDIQRVEQLSPKKAVLLTLHTVRALTRYTHADIKKGLHVVLVQINWT